MWKYCGVSTEMTVNIHYVEKAGSMQGLMIVDDPNDANKKQEFPMPKFIFDLIKASVQAGTLNLSTLWDRDLDITKSLP